MSVHRGRLTSLEVAVLWQLVSSDKLPFPLTHRATQGLEDDYIREKQETAARLVGDPPSHVPPGWDGDITEMLKLWQAAVNPDIVIWAAGQGPDETDMSVVTRVIGLRRESYAVVLVQQPGERIELGGDIDVYQTDVVGLARAVIEQLPKAGRGRWAEVTIPHRPDAVDSGNSSPVLDSLDPVSRQSHRWLTAKTVQRGELRVEPGSAAHWIQDRSGFLIRWRDLADDGRYVIEPKPDPVAIAVDDEAFEIVVNQRVAELVRRIRENRPAERGFRVS